MLASGDVLVAVLEPEASRFSIPSKVLSYLAAGRPILALTPESNPCVVDVTAGGGLVVAPTPKGAAEGAAWVSSDVIDAERRDGIGAQARAYAQSKFDISGIADEFEDLLSTDRGSGALTIRAKILRRLTFPVTAGEPRWGPRWTLVRIGKDC